MLLLLGYCFFICSFSLCRLRSVWPPFTLRSLSEMRANPSTTWRWQQTAGWADSRWFDDSGVYSSPHTLCPVTTLQTVCDLLSSLCLLLLLGESLSESLFIVASACRITLLCCSWVSVMRVALVCSGTWEEPQNTTNEQPKRATRRPRACWCLPTPQIVRIIMCFCQ